MLQADAEYIALASLEGALYLYAQGWRKAVHGADRRTTSFIEFSTEAGMLLG